MILIMVLIIVRIAIANALFSEKTPYIIPEKALADFEQAWQRAEDSVNKEQQKIFPEKKKLISAKFDSGYRSNGSPTFIVLELNSADTLDLQQLKGIGPGYARRIVNYRQRLGGYFSPRQLLEVYGMDSARYQAIAEHLTINRDSIHPLDINKATLKELLWHPYFPFPLAKSILVYRQKNKQIRSLEEFKSAAGLSDTLFRRLIIYVRL